MLNVQGTGIANAERHVGFVSYAHDDAPAAQRLVALLRPRLEIARDVDVEVWWDRELVAGDRWFERIEERCVESTFALLFLSPSFLASGFIAAHELPRLVSSGRLVFPVGLVPVDFAIADLRGLGRYQVFRYLPDGSRRHLCFLECSGANRERFADQLVREVIGRLKEALVG